MDDPFSSAHPVRIAGGFRRRFDFEHFAALARAPFALDAFFRSLLVDLDRDRRVSRFVLAAPGHFPALQRATRLRLPTDHAVFAGVFLVRLPKIGDDLVAISEKPVERAHDREKRDERGDDAPFLFLIHNDPGRRRRKPRFDVFSIPKIPRAKSEAAFRIRRAAAVRPEDQAFGRRDPRAISELFSAPRDTSGAHRQDDASWYSLISNDHPMSHPVLTPIPLLLTQRLALRPVRDDDLDALLALRSNESVNRYLARSKTPTAEEVRAFIKRLRAEEAAYWAITENEALIGAICLYGLAPEERRIEIGFELHPDFQGRGYMREALAEVVAFAFRSGVLTIEGRAHKANRASLSVLAKAGFARDLDAEARERGSESLRDMTISSLRHPIGMAGISR
ncbi:MAG: GNAT family N-acetyltransferase [Parvularculaceae bacterium]|nr:GNAT family N-acetyltransferase [Parvularculaceae bacterium]